MNVKQPSAPRREQGSQLRILHAGDQLPCDKIEMSRSSVPPSHVAHAALSPPKNDGRANATKKLAQWQDALLANNLVDIADVLTWARKIRREGSLLAREFRGGPSSTRVMTILLASLQQPMAQKILSHHGADILGSLIQVNDHVTFSASCSALGATLASTAAQDAYFLVRTAAIVEGDFFHTLTVRLPRETLAAALEAKSGEAFGSVMAKADVEAALDIVQTLAPENLDALCCRQQAAVFKGCSHSVELYDLLSRLGLQTWTRRPATQ